jgi:hypothetical protein
MKYLLSLICLFSILTTNAQSYNGKGDKKFQVGINLQDHANSINTTFDYGIGQNISVGLSSSYALGLADDLDAEFGDRFDLKARFNAHLGNIINISHKFDIYPGLHLGFKNFGGHAGARYFFSDGLGVFSEFSVPFAKYNTDDLTTAEELHNQFTISLGVSFNL